MKNDFEILLPIEKRKLFNIFQLKANRTTCSIL